MIQQNTHNKYSKVDLKDHDDNNLDDENKNETYVVAEGKEARDFHDHPTAQLRRSILSPSRPISPYKKGDVSFQRVHTHDVDENPDEDAQNRAVTPSRTTAQNTRDTHIQCKYSSNQSVTTSTTKNTATVEKSNVSDYSANDDIELSDDEEDLGRYNFDFNHTIGINDPFHLTNNNNSTRKLFGSDIEVIYGENNLYGQPSKFPSCGSNNQYASAAMSSGKHSTKSSVLARIQDCFEAIKLMQMESRRKRMEFLLALPDDDNYSSKCHYCATKIMILLSSSWCDLLDKGSVLIVLFTLIFVVVYESLDEEEDRDARQLLLGLGIPLLVIRVVWRPLYWFVWGRRIERRRQNTLELYDELNGEHGTRGLEIPYIVKSEVSDGIEDNTDDVTVNMSNIVDVEPTLMKS